MLLVLIPGKSFYFLRSFDSGALKKMPRDSKFWKRKSKSKNLLLLGCDLVSCMTSASPRRIMKICPALANRVAQIDLRRVRTTGRLFSVIGKPRVNMLLLNLALKELQVRLTCLYLMSVVAEIAHYSK
jgi:hypothetical protein